MGKVISAFRVVGAFPPFEIGEVFEVSRGFAITSLDTRIGIRIVKELFKAAVGEPSAFELAYRDSMFSPADASGVVFLDMATYDCPGVDIRGPILYEQEEWCDNVTRLCAENNRHDLGRCLAKSAGNIVLFSAEPMTGCLMGFGYYNTMQYIISSSRGDCVDPCLAVEAHAVVDRGYIARKTYKELGKLYSGRLDGYVAKVTVVGNDPTRDYYYPGAGRQGTYVYYSGGNGYIVSHPSSAYIYKTSRAAEDSINEKRSYWYRDLAGGPRRSFSLSNGQKMKKEVLTVSQWREEIWGNQTGVNHFAEIVKS